MGKIQKYKTFSVLIEKETREVHQNGNKNSITISSKKQNRTKKQKIKQKNYGERFMAISSSNSADNLAEGIHKMKCKDYGFFLNIKP